MIEDNREAVSGKAARDAIIVAARYIIRTFANLLARGHPGPDGRTKVILHTGGDGEGDREYVPCVSDFIISVRRNVRHPTKARARKRDLMWEEGERGRAIFDEDTAHPGAG